MKKKSKALKIILFSFVGLVVAATAGLMIYRAVFSMGVAPDMQIGDVLSQNRYLLVTQQSDYKDAVLAEIGNLLDDDMCIDVVDVTNLSSVDARRYRAVYILTTIESSDIPQEVYSFWNQNPNMPSKLTYTAASGRWDNGENLPVGVDALATASTKDNTSDIAQDVILFFNKN